MSANKLFVEIDPAAGFCFGVQAAVHMADHALDKGLKLNCLGDLLHNEEENSRLQNKGMQVIQHEDLPDIKGQTVLFRAHGEPPMSYELARHARLEVMDGTCPVVKKLQDRVRKDHESGSFILLLGKSDHPEIVGINGNIGNQALVIQSYKELMNHDLPAEVVVYCQTTMGENDLKDLVDYLHACNIKVKVNNTICKKVSGRIPKLKSFAANYDVILFVGGKNSSNARQLFGVCQQINSRTYFVSEISDIQMKWFQPGDKVGITGGTSTPVWLMDNIKYLLSS